jgi:ATP-dependent Clp protease ATP-binding subunit ClpA
MDEEASPQPTPRYRTVVDGSVGVAREMGHSYVGVEHLFLAVIRERAAVPTQVLAGLIDLDRVEAALLGEMGSAGYRGETPGGTQLGVGVPPRYVPQIKGFPG